MKYREDAEERPQATFDVVGIGNAIVDVISHESDQFLKEFELVKESMALIDTELAVNIYEKMSSTSQSSGGSAANTMTGITSLGGSAAYIGKVRKDSLGEFFIQDIHNAKVHYSLDPARNGLPTARSMIIVTPDGARTMNTYLGISTTLYKEDLDVEVLENSKVLYCEGYIWDIEEGPALAKKAAEIARQNSTTIAISLSDSFCVERHRESFKDFVRSEANIVFADEDEIHSLFGTKNNEEMIEILSTLETLFAVTRAENGSIIINDKTIIKQDATKVEKIIDTTGAGDAYASGFLYGWTKDQTLSKCAEYGTYCATKIIQQLGARIEKGLLNDLS